MTNLRHQSIIYCIIAVYLLLAVGGVRTILPWCDEAWFASPALNLISNGTFGTSVLDPTSDFRLNRIAGIDRYTYWIVPLYPLTQAAWYTVFGFGLFSLRFYSVAFGLIALAACYITLKVLSGNRRVATVAVALLSIDFTFQWTASVGRMDMMCAALGQAAFAAFLWLRTRNFPLALLVSQTLVAAAGLSHPMGLGAFAGLLFLTLYFDRSRIKLSYVALAAVPYIVGAAAWGLYITKDLPLFLAQFGGNTAGRLLSVTTPLEMLRLQIVDRYLYMFGLAPDTKGFSHLKILILLAYLAGFVGAWSNREIRNNKGYRALLLLCVVCFGTWMFVDREIHFFYLIHFVIFLTVIFAVWVCSCWERRTLPRWVLVGIVAMVMTIQLGTIGRRTIQNPYRNMYLPTTQFLKRHASPSQLIIGSAELAFQLGFNTNVVDDYRLGFRSGKKPDFVVIDKNRYEEWIPLLEQQDPPAFRYVTDMMEHDFHLVLDRGAYKIYSRQNLEARSSTSK